MGDPADPAPEAEVVVRHSVHFLCRHCVRIRYFSKNVILSKKSLLKKVDSNIMIHTMMHYMILDTFLQLAIYCPFELCG